MVRVVDPPRLLPRDGAYLEMLGIPGWETRGEGVAGGFKFWECPLGHQFDREGFKFGGIWQPVEVLITDPVYISDIFVEPNLAQGSIESHVEITSKGHAETGEVHVHTLVRPWKAPDTVVGEGGRGWWYSTQVLRPSNVPVKIRGPRSWSPDDPFLYVAEVTVGKRGQVRSRSSTRFALREFVVKNGYFHLNGKRIFIKSGHHQGTYPTTLEYPPTREFVS